VAEQLGVNLATVRNWEQGVFRPTADMAARIVTWLGYEPKLP